MIYPEQDEWCVCGFRRAEHIATWSGNLHCPEGEGVYTPEPPTQTMRAAPVVCACGIAAVDCEYHR